MILELLLLVAILWFATQGHKTQPVQLQMLDPSHKIRIKLEQLGWALDELCRQANIVANYTLVVSDTSSYVTDKEIIHLLLWNTKTDDLFDDNTLMSAAIHELTHVICPTRDHSELFNKMEDDLLTLAENLDYYRSDQPVDEAYPCFDLDG